MIIKMIKKIIFIYIVQIRSLVTYTLHHLLKKIIKIPKLIYKKMSRVKKMELMMSLDHYHNHFNSLELDDVKHDSCT